jgi:MerR family mercuric resistance operon transcriptional regulator
MRIGELANTVGLTTQTIRFYERKGLLPAPERGANGYRTYGESTLTRLNFINHARAAGLTLAEIGSIIDIRDHGDATCTHVTTLVNSKLTTVRARIRGLAVLEAELEGLLERSHRLDPADCTDADICHILSAPG